MDDSTKPAPLIGVVTEVDIDNEPAELIIGKQTMPFVVGFDAQGPITARDLAQLPRIAPVDCSHAGACWSPNLAMRCPRCRSPLFLPPRLLAHLDAATIVVMDALWTAAGCPEWGQDAWNIRAKYWNIQTHPLFAHCGGLPVRHDRQDHYWAACQEYDL